MNLHIKRKSLLISIALLAPVLAAGGAWVFDSGTAKAEPTTPADSRPALMVCTTVPHQGKWSAPLPANGSVRV